MGFKIKSPSPNVYFPILLSLLFLLVSSSSAKVLPLRVRRSNLPAHHRKLYGGDKKHPPPTTPFFLNRREAVTGRKQMEKKKKKITGFKIIGNSNIINKPTAFSVMLPKGFVPPSGSSPCHNDNPESVAFYCHLSATNP